MIEYIKGQLVHLGIDHIVVENNNMGYRIATSTNSISELNQTNDSVKIYTKMIVKEDDISLCGFSTEQELEMFVHLTSVSGVGTKVGISMLSAINYKMLIGFIQNADVNALVKAPGIGKKTAQRIILELKDKMNKLYPLSSGVEPEIFSVTVDNDAQEALLALGYSLKEVQSAFKSNDFNGLSTEEIIKQSLTYFVKRG